MAQLRKHPVLGLVSVPTNSKKKQQPVKPAPEKPLGFAVSTQAAASRAGAAPPTIRSGPWNAFARQAQSVAAGKPRVTVSPSGRPIGT